MILYINENNENEVRYIDTTISKGYGDKRVVKKDSKQVLNQEPIKNGEKIRVYHGCTLKTAVTALKIGLSGKDKAIRTYSYEAGMNPIGLFVTTDFNVAKKFGNSYGTLCVLEFTVNSNDLDTPVWNNSSSYFGQGSNPMPFDSKEDRDRQKEEYNTDALNSKDEYISKSDNPAMAERIFDNPEHQALFIGDLNPNMIKRVWVNAKDEEKGYVDTTKAYIPYKRSDFLKKFGETEFYVDGTYSPSQYRKVEHSDKLFLPNEDFTSIEDMAERQYQYDMKYRGDYIRGYIKRHYNGDEKAYKEHEIKDNLEGIEYVLKDESAMYCLQEYLWPKQLIQLLGKEKYEKLFDRFGIGTKNESKKSKKIYIKESKLPLLRENASSVLYHFTDFETFKKIAMSDDFKLSRTDAYSSSDSELDSNTVNDELNGDYKYYISFTRSPNANQGFSQWYMPNSNMSDFGEDDDVEHGGYKGIVRIEFDGDKLNHNFKSRPIDFFTHKFQTMTAKERAEHEENDRIKFPNDTTGTSSKEVQLSTPNKRRETNTDTWVNPNPFFVQNEDRLVSNEPYIDNVSRYITRVDIKIYDKYKEEGLQDVFNIVHKTILGKEGKIHLYKDFEGLNRIRKGKDMRINGDIEGDSSSFESI